MGGCIECALCVEACPFRAIVMAPDFEFGTYDREQSLVFNMHELASPAPPRSTRRWSSSRASSADWPARPARPALVPAAAGAGAAGAAGSAQRRRHGRARSAAAAQPPPQAAAAAAAAAAPAAAASCASGSGRERWRRRDDGGRSRRRPLSSGPLGFTADLAGLKPAGPGQNLQRARGGGRYRPAGPEGVSGRVMRLRSSSRLCST